MARGNRRLSRTLNAREPPCYLSRIASLRYPCALALAALLGACGAPPRSVEAPAPPPWRIVHAASGETIALDALVDALAGARAIYLGERHDRAEDHELQRRIGEALATRGSLAVGFEMFQHGDQPALDAYAAGEIDEAALLSRTEWEARWRFDFAMYRPLVALGPTRGAALIGLNVPREVTRTVAREGLGALSPEQRAALPELDLDDAAHRATVFAALAHHPGMDPEALERFYVAQVIWDEAMATRVADVLGADGAPARMVVVLGGMHARRSAVPARAARRGVTPYAIVLPVSEAELDLEQARRESAADYLFVTRE